MLAAFPPPLAGKGADRACPSRRFCSTRTGLSGVLLDQRLAGWLGLRGHTSARCRIAPAGTVGRDGRILQSRVVAAVDHPIDLAAVDADVLERSVIERAKLARRRVALAAQRVGAPPFARRGGDRRGKGADGGKRSAGGGPQRAQDGAGKVAQCLGAGGFGAVDDTLPRPFPLLRRQAIVIKSIFVVDKHAHLLRSRSRWGLY